MLSGTGKAVTSPRRLKHQTARLVIAAGVNIGTDPLKREQNGLNGIDAPNVHDLLPLRPVNFISARPGATASLRSKKSE